uniref:Putative secreted protein n=1 Tax=Anopheles darlingi TaxID=43151 RepID=A0A2M4D233_ANODA
MSRCVHRPSLAWSHWLCHLATDSLLAALRASLVPLWLLQALSSARMMPIGIMLAMTQAASDDIVLYALMTLMVMSRYVRFNFVRLPACDSKTGLHTDPPYLSIDVETLA